ncbi:MAG: Rpn family recombination-promoting nuclease/putative transposase [Oscillospiraceae bacterium]|nr:Rpn family recombination-promoting nuclease/putative transposase [Oscillospiraceae bacterium]
MNSRELLPVKSDVVFRMFFADERNAEFLVSFLKSVLKLPEDDYNEIEIADPHLLREYDGDKLAIIDVKLRTKSRKVVHIEIQLKVSPELKNRIILYDSKLIAEQIGSGDDYAVIKQVISIVITDEKLIDGSGSYHHRFSFYDRDAGVELSDIIEIHTLELDKLPEGADGTELYDWAKFIAADTEEELNMIAERNPQVAKAVVRLRELSADERTRDTYERREKARRDHAAQTRWAVKQREFAIAKNMMRIGLPIEKIVEVTDLTSEEIESAAYERQ